MADRVVQTTASGASVAVDTVGTRDFQLLKIAGGTSQTEPVAATSGVPAASSIGLIVSPKPGASVTVVAMPAVSGTVQVSGAIQASGTVSVSGTVLASIVPGVSVTIQQGASVSAVVSGTVNVGTVQTILSTVNVAIVAGAGGGGSVTTAQPSISATGQVIWIAGGQHTTGVPVRVTGTVDVSVSVSVSAAVENITVVSTVGTLLGTVNVNVVAGGAAVTNVTVVSTIVTILGTQVVTVVPGLSVNVGGLATAAYTTTGIPAASSNALIVALKAGATVNVPAGLSVTVAAAPAVSGTLSVNVLNAGLNATVTGTVNIAGSALISGTISVTSDSTAPIWVTGTVAAGAGTTVISGTVSVVNGVSVAFSAPYVTTAAPSTSAAGIVVWNANAGSVVVENITAVSTIVTILGTQMVSIAQTSVVAQVSGTVNLPAGYQVVVASSVMTASNIFGLPVWIAGGQSPTGQAIKVSGTVDAVVANGVSVAFSAPYVTTAAPSTSAAGIVVWNANAGSVVVENITVVSTVGTLLGTVNVTVIGTALASIVPGVSVNLGSLATVAVTTTGIPAAASTALMVAIKAGFSGTVSVATGTINIATGVVQLAGGATNIGSVFVSAGTVNVATGTVAIAGSVAISGTVPVSLATGTVNVATGTVNVATGTVSVLDVGRTAVRLIVSQTSVGISGGTLAFTVQVGLSVPVGGTTSWVVPAGKTFRLLSGNLIADASVTTSPVHVHLNLLASTALPTWTTTVPFFMPLQAWAFSAGIAAYGQAAAIEDIGAGVTIGIAHTIGTSGGTIYQGVYQGFLFP